MEILQIPIYRLDELSQSAKEKALNKHRHINVEDDWYQFVLNDFTELCKTIGIEVNKKEINFRGFWSQGDGSTFSAEVDLFALLHSIKTEAWKDYAPKISLSLTLPIVDKRVMRLIEKEIIDANCNIVNPHNGYWIKVMIDFRYTEKDKHHYGNIETQLDLLEKWLKKTAEALNRVLYKQLKEEYSYYIADQVVEEALLANDYVFTENGRDANWLADVATFQQNKD